MAGIAVAGWCQRIERRLAPDRGAGGGSRRKRLGGAVSEAAMLVGRALGAFELV